MLDYSGKKSPDFFASPTLKLGNSLAPDGARNLNNRR